MMARTIHQASGRAGKTMLAFNCTAVPRDMLESQLFGDRKRAFTGAARAPRRSARPGRHYIRRYADEQ
ncbi:MAG: sigma 54-interacting transcriptional regulator [Acidobacteria bacterium]|nr:sigma 54-interacting transcriptional regulator [Acidobacteriota bacterium]